MRLKRKNVSYETAKLVRAMERRGLNSATLAQQADVSLRAVQNLLSDCHSGRPLRARLNAFFGEPIFNLEYQRKPGRPRRQKISLSLAAPARATAADTFPARHFAQRTGIADRPSELSTASPAISAANASEAPGGDVRLRPATNPTTPPHNHDQTQ